MSLALRSLIYTSWYKGCKSETALRSLRIARGSQCIARGSQFKRFFGIRTLSCAISKARARRRRAQTSSGACGLQTGKIANLWVVP